jgi:hypothetical protein
MIKQKQTTNGPSILTAKPAEVTSGSKLTFESRMGFPARDGRANLRDARWKIALRFLRRYSSAQSSGSRPQHAAEAGLAG